MLRFVLIALLAAAVQASKPADPVADALAEMQRGNCARALEISEAAVRANPRLVPMYRVQGECHLRLGDAFKAVAAVERGLEANPRAPELTKFLGQILFRYNGDNLRAGELLKAASEALPNDPEAHHYYAQWALINHLEEITIRAEQQVLKTPGLSDLARLQAYTLIGLAAENLQKTDDAEAAFRKALEVNRRQKKLDPGFAHQYVDFLNRSGRSEEAQALIEEILRGSPEYGPARLEKAKFYDSEQQPEKAIEEAEKALALPGLDATRQRAAHVLLAKNYFVLGKQEQAQAHQRWIEANTPQRPAQRGGR